MAAWKDYIDIALGLASIAAVVGSGLVAWMVAVRYRIPKLEQRVQVLELVKPVQKHEIYCADGHPIYMHRLDCANERGECGDDRAKAAEQAQAVQAQILARLDAMEEKRAKAREQMLSFMSAVKEKLNLKFTVPEN